jgi:hypothetical protein
MPPLSSQQPPPPLDAAALALKYGVPSDKYDDHDSSSDDNDNAGAHRGGGQAAFGPGRIGHSAAASYDDFGGGGVEGLEEDDPESAAAQVTHKLYKHTNVLYTLHHRAIMRHVDMLFVV